MRRQAINIQRLSQKAQGQMGLTGLPSDALLGSSAQGRGAQRGSRSHREAALPLCPPSHGMDTVPPKTESAQLLTKASGEKSVPSTSTRLSYRISKVRNGCNKTTANGLSSLTA